MKQKLATLQETDEEYRHVVGKLKIINDVDVEEYKSITKPDLRCLKSQELMSKLIQIFLVDLAVRLNMSDEQIAERNVILKNLMTPMPSGYGMGERNVSREPASTKDGGSKLYANEDPRPTLTDLTPFGVPVTNYAEMPTPHNSQRMCVYTMDTRTVFAFIDGHTVERGHCFTLESLE
jgi:hypothetical protein